MLMRMPRDSCVAEGYVKKYSTLENSLEFSFKKLNIAIPYNPETVLLSIYPREMKPYVHTKICM